MIMHKHNQNVAFGWFSEYIKLFSFMTLAFQHSDRSIKQSPFHIRDTKLIVILSSGKTVFQGHTKSSVMYIKCMMYLAFSITQEYSVFAGNQTCLYM